MTRKRRRQSNGGNIFNLTYNRNPSYPCCAAGDVRGGHSELFNRIQKMRYAIIQNDNKQESLFWHEQTQKWYQLDGDYNIVGCLVEVMRERPNMAMEGELLSTLSRAIEKKYA
jgi:hypothetical protein